MILKRTLFALFALLICGLASIALAPSSAIAGDETDTSGSADGGGTGGGPGAPAPETDTGN
jgi:hypothetical protein